MQQQPINPYPRFSTVPGLWAGIELRRSLAASFALIQFDQQQSAGIQLWQTFLFLLNLHKLIVDKAETTELWTSHENLLAVHIFKFDKFGHRWCLFWVLNVPEVTPGKLLRFLKKHTLSRWSLKEALELSDDISEEVMSYARQQLWWIRSDTCQRPQCARFLLKFWNYMEFWILASPLVCFLFMWFLHMF